MKKSVLSLGVVTAFLLSACASSHYKARQEQREKLAASSGMYCEWVNGEKHSDVDVELSLEMAKRCDSSKSFSITTYKNTSDQNGVIYCCVMQNSGSSSSSSSSSGKSSGPAAKKSGGDSSEPEIKE